jgi:hypothetical protein
MFSFLVLAIVGGIAFYVLGSLGVRGSSNGVEYAARSLAIALNAALNLAVWCWLSPSWGFVLGLPLAAVGVLAAIRSVAKRAGYQSTLGWASWLMPMSWPASILGLLVFAAAMIRGSRARVDAGTGTIETYGLPRIGFRGGFNLGNFTFLLGTPPTPFTAIGISSHETGHTLNVAAFGSVWHLVGNGIEQNVKPFARGVLAYGELLAESRRPDPTQPVLPHWG